MTSLRGHRGWLVEAALMATVAAAWTACLLLGLGGEKVAQTVSNLGLLLCATAAGACCVAAGHRAEGRSRRLWLLLGASALSWAAGQGTWSWYESVRGLEVPFPSLADVGYLGAVPLAVAALLQLPTGAAALAGRLRTVLDGLMIAGSVLLASWVLVLEPLFNAGGGTVLAQAISLAYPIGDAVVITIVLYVALRQRQTARRGQASLLLIGVALVCIAVADLGFVYLTATGTYASGNFIDAGWFAGFSLLGLAARRPAPALEEDGDETLPELLTLMLPYLAVIAALVVTVVVFQRTHSHSTFTFWSRSFIIAALVVRQVLSLLENRSLARGLEARVVERTAELRVSEQRFGALVQHSSDVLTVVDRAGIVSYQSESLARVFGFGPEELLGLPVDSLLEEGAGRQLRATLVEAAQQPSGMLVVELPVRDHAGRMRTAEITITNLLDNAAVNGLVLNTRDISERKTLESQLVHQAFHDSLTALPNRALFRDRVGHALVRGAKTRGQVAVLFLDLDGFKELNDTLGHAMGDLLLVQVAERLRRCVRPGDTVARVGGDEFAVLLDDSIGELDAVGIGSRITTALQDAFLIDGREIHVRGSIGIARADVDAEDADQLLRNADLAMFRAKGLRQGGIEHYDPGMHSDLVRRVELEADLRGGMDRGEFWLQYQPTVDLRTGAMVGVEALLRWQHPQRGLISPTEFIPLAESCGVINRLGLWVLHEACRQTAAWHRRYGQVLSVNVNVSARQLQQPDFLGEVVEVLEATGLSPAHLVLELTETVLVDSAELIDLLARIKALGVRWALDDFGTGYSSLSYLHRFPIDILKIDRSFVQQLSRRRDRSEFARTIVRLGQSLELCTVAEGIENQTQLAALKRMGCDVGQGFHLGRPMEAGALEERLKAAQSSRTVVAIP